jgi:AcrR family transcriptional regulator
VPRHLTGDRAELPARKSTPPPSTIPLPSTRLPAASRRRQLLAVAKEVLGDRGFHQTTMAEIAAAAGVTKPVLYQHFSSKRDLYTAVLRDAGNQLQEAINEANDRAESPREQVELGFEAYVRFVQEDPNGFRLLFSSTSRRDEEWAAIGESVTNSIAETAAARIQVEGMSPSHRRVLARGLIGMAEGMMRYWHSGDVDGLDFDDLLADLQTLAWRGLRGLGNEP